MIAPTSNIDSGQNSGQSAATGPAAVGAWLRAARERRGASLDDIARTTRIGKGYLEAIEDGDLSRLPGIAYTRGFVRLYANQLGLSPDEAMNLFDNSLANDHEQDEPVTETIPYRPERKFNLQPYNRYILTAILLLTVASLIYHFLQPEHRGKSAQTGPVPPTVPAPPVSARPTPKANDAGQADQAKTGPAPEKSDAAPAGGIVLRLKALSDGKLHINIDGTIAQEYDLVTGDLVEWKADSNIQLDLENAGAVEGELDGSPLKPFGETGKAAHLVIRKDGVHPQ